MDVGLFLLSFVFIYAGSTLFTNGVEWLGRKLRLSESVVGCVLAAVGTALPETLIPIIAILFVGGVSGNNVGIGAILGAPFMLGTLAMFVTGASILAFRNRREQGTTLNVRGPTKKRDLRFFLITYFIAVMVSLIPIDIIKPVIAPLFIAIYFVYLARVFKAEDVCCKAVLDPLTLDVLAAKLRKGTARDAPTISHTVVQVVLSLVLIIAGAQLFVNQIVSLAESLHLDATILALIVAPVATELPEKLNSVLWVRQGKDTLALGNITGAMVFQSCIPVAFGVAFTPWVLGRLEAINVSLTLIAGVVLYLQATKDRMTARSLLFNGVFYFMFLGLVIIFAYYPL
jgi:cation:H+ antiporter